MSTHSIIKVQHQLDIGQKLQKIIQKKEPKCEIKGIFDLIEPNVGRQPNKKGPLSNSEPFRVLLLKWLVYYPFCAFEIIELNKLSCSVIAAILSTGSVRASSKIQPSYLIPVNKFINCWYGYSPKFNSRT